MSSIEQIHNWSDYSGWEWDGFYLWPKWSYRAWENIDTRKLENWAMICSKIINTEDTYDGSILAVNPYASNSFSTDTWSWWKIYEQGELKITLSSWTSAHNAIMWFWKMTKLSDSTTYVYWFSQTSSWTGKCFRISTDYSTATDLSQDFTLALWRTANANYMPVLSLPGKIIFGYGNTIFQLSNSEILTELISFPKDAEIVSITYYQDTYKIFYNIPKYSNWPKEWFINYWDWISSSVSTFVKYDNSGILNVVNDGAYDYVVFWNTYSNDLYLVSGINRQELRINTENSINNTRLLWIEWVIREWVLYMTWINKLWNYCLYSYWNYYPWFNKSLMPENSWIYINKMYAGIRNLYIYSDDAWWDWVGGIYTKSFLFNSDSESSATLFSYAITGNFWIYTFKTIKEIDIAFNLVNELNSIKLYAKTTGWPTANNTTWRTLIKTITWTSVRWVKIYWSELSSLGIWEWNQLEYKAELIAANTTSPILNQVKTIYLDNIK